MRTVLMLDWRVRQYRRPFYRLVQRRLAQAGVRFVVGVIQPPPVMAARSDNELHPDDLEVDARWFEIGSRSFVYRQLRHPLRSLSPDIVVSEQAIRNVDLVPLLLRSPKRRPAVALWGHGRTYAGGQSTKLERYKEWLTCRGDWFFAYTDEGRDWALSIGYPGDRVSVLWNSTDTRALRQQIHRLPKSRVQDFQQEQNLVPGKTALYLGGLDAAKKVGVLLDAAERAHAVDPDFVLLIGGAGSDATKVRHIAAQHPWLRYLGRVDGQPKALAMAASDMMLIPDNVGLIATDALAAGLPVVTTFGESHGPEFGYLQHGRTALITERGAPALAEGVCELLRDPAQRDRMREECLTDVGNYSIEHMASSFQNGIIQLLGDNSSNQRR